MEKVVSVLNEMLVEERINSAVAVATKDITGETYAVDTMVTLKEVAERLGVLDEVKHNFL